MTRRIILIGGGGHCKSCIDVIEDIGTFDIVGILDKAEKVGERILDYPIIGTDEDINSLIRDDHSFLITIGQIGHSSKRQKLYNLIKKQGGKLPCVIAKDAYCSKYALVKAGTIIMHQALVQAGATIGENCIINDKALVEHDAVIGNHCHIATGAIINGGVSLGAGSFMGSASTTKQNISIPEKSFIKANTIYI